MKVRVLSPVEKEITQAALWYENRQAGLGADFFREYERAICQIEEHPLRYAKLETVKAFRDIRRLFLHRFPYYIAYEVMAEEVVVLAAAHTSRRPTYWLHRLGG